MVARVLAQDALEPVIDFSWVPLGISALNQPETRKVHLDGYNLIPALKGDAQDWPRKEMLYGSDDGDLMALRYDRWKVIFQEQL
jgi:hypothetical protein